MLALCTGIASIVYHRTPLVTFFSILAMQSSLRALVLFLAAGPGRPRTSLCQPPRRAPRLSVCAAACLLWAQPRAQPGR